MCGIIFTERRFFMDYKKHIAEKLKIELDKSELYGFIETPPNNDMGDFALPCFKLAKIMRRPPVKIAEELASNFDVDEYISECTAVNGYLNFKINRKSFAFSLLLLATITASQISAKGRPFVLTIRQLTLQNLSISDI